MAGRFVGTYLRARPVLLLDDLGAELDAAGRREAGSALKPKAKRAKLLKAN